MDFDHRMQKISRFEWETLFVSCFFATVFGTICSPTQCRKSACKYSTDSFEREQNRREKEEESSSMEYVVFALKTQSQTELKISTL